MGYLQDNLQNFVPCDAIVHRPAHAIAQAKAELLEDKPGDVNHDAFSHRQLRPWPELTKEMLQMHFPEIREYRR
ncbi:hypothetical protein ES703_74335 [subsurface metagenome]